MNGQFPVLLALDLLGTFAFGLNGALTAVRAVRLDIVGVLTLGMITALGGGIVRDLLLGETPPATFQDWRYLAAAAAGALIAYGFARFFDRLAWPVEILDAIGLGIFAVAGASKAVEFGLGPVQATILGVITAVGGGTLRDVIILQIPSVMRTGLYAIPALVASVVAVVTAMLGAESLLTALAAAGACFLIRILGVKFGWNMPGPPEGWPRRSPARPVAGPDTAPGPDA